jgi:serine/threonine protein kinase
LKAKLGPGSRLGAHRLGDELGHGGMGVVWRATDEALGRHVAIKVLAPAASKDARFLERFRREAHACGRVSHRNVVRVHAAREDAGHLYIVMELVSGGSLARRLERGGALPWREAARLAAGIARGLEAIHRAGLVHRDVKPANVLLDESGVPRVTDFGIVSSLDPTATTAARLTATDEVVGTVAYMAPEQTTHGQVDSRSDLYALGATLHELVTGRLPFSGSCYEILEAKRRSPPPALRSLVPEAPVELERLVRRLLEPDPALRPRSAGKVARELEAIAAVGQSPGRAGTLRVSLAALAVAGILAAVAVGSSRPTVEPPREAASPPVARTTSSVSIALAPSPAGETPYERAIRFLKPGRCRSKMEMLELARVIDLGDSLTSIACSTMNGFAGKADGTAMVFSLDAPDRSTFAAHRGAVTALAPVTTNTFLFSCGDDGKVTLWNWARRSPVGTWAAFRQRARSLALNDPACTTIFVASEDGEVAVAPTLDDWPPPASSIHRIETNEPVTRVISGGASWGFFATGHVSGHLGVWGRRSFTAVVSFWAGYSGKCLLAGSNSGTYVAGGEGGSSFDGGELFPAGPRLTYNLPSGYRLKALAESPDGDLAAAATKAGPILLFDLLAPFAQPDEIALPTDYPAEALAWRPDGRGFIAATREGFVLVFARHQAK